MWPGLADHDGIVGDGDPAPPPDQAADEPEVRVGDEVNAVLLAILPWAISLLLHVAIVLLAIFVVWSVKVDLDAEETIIPDARLSRTPGAPLQMRQTSSRTRSSGSRRSVSRARSESSSLVESKSAQTRLIGTVGATGGRASPFGMAIDTGAGLDASFFGTGGNARKLVYVIDASGSLIDTLDFVVNELKRSINDLSEQQTFAVFFFQGDDVVEVPPRSMKPATAENKDLVRRWIDPAAGNIIAGGKTNPVKAIERALRYRPDLVFLLSDNITGQGIYQVDQHMLLKAIEAANRGGTKINTLQFLYPDPLERDGYKPTMELIAAASGGRYRFIDARELGIE